MPRDLPYGLSLIRSPSPVEVGFGKFATHAKAVKALYAEDRIESHEFDLWIIDFRGVPVSVGYFDDEKFILVRKALKKVSTVTTDLDYRWAWNVLYDAPSTEDFLWIFASAVPHDQAALLLYEIVCAAVRPEINNFDYISQDALRKFLSDDMRTAISQSLDKAPYFSNESRDAIGLNILQRKLLQSVADFYRFIHRADALDKGYYFVNSIGYAHDDDMEAAKATLKSLVSFPKFMSLI